MDAKDIREIEQNDFDFIENVLVSLWELWKRKLLIILCTVAGFLVSLIFISLNGNSLRYYSSATLFSAVYGSYSDTTAGVAVMNRYTDLIGSSRVCRRAAQALTDFNISTNDLQEMVEDGDIEVSGASTMSTSYGYKLVISVFSDKEDQVLSIANAMAAAFAAELNDLLGTQTIQVMDEADSYGAFYSLNIKLYILAFTAAAFILSCGLIFVSSFFSPWARSIAQCEDDEEMILGLLPYSKR